MALKKSLAICILRRVRSFGFIIMSEKMKTFAKRKPPSLLKGQFLIKEDER